MVKSVYCWCTDTFNSCCIYTDASSSQAKHGTNSRIVTTSADQHRLYPHHASVRWWRIRSAMATYAAEAEAAVRVTAEQR